MSMPTNGPRINFNAPAMKTVNHLDTMNGKIARSMERISSGERVTRAADAVDVFGISEHMRGQIRSMHSASRNVQDGIALLNVAEGALAEVHDMLHRMRELSVQSATGTLTDEDRSYIEVEVDKLKEEINHISTNTQYNGQPLLSGESDWGKEGGYFQIGTYNIDHTDNIRHHIDVVNTETLNLDTLTLATQDGAQEAIDTVKAATDMVTNVRSTLGATANRLEESWRNTEKMIEENTAYDSLMRDTDIPGEMVEHSKNQIIHQYANAMLAQANQTPQSILQLLNK